MNRILSKPRNLLIPIGLTICLLILTTSCASGVSQEEYDQLESELAQVSAELEQTREELASTQAELQAGKSLWKSVAPTIQLMMLLWPRLMDEALLQTGVITSKAYAQRCDMRWEEVDACLAEIANDELTEKVTDAWPASFFSPTGMIKWGEAFNLLVVLGNEGLERASKLMGQ